MAQSLITVTPTSPTPPTNMSFLGTTPPTAPAQPAADDGTAGSLTVFATQTASVDGSGYPSLPHEGSGSETVVTAPGSRAECPTIAFSCLGAYTTNPNGDHASSLTPSGATTLASITPGSSVSGVGSTTLGATGTNFTKQSVIYVNGVAQTTTYTSRTSINAPSVTKRTTAGSWPVTVVTGGAVVTAPVTWTFT